MNDRPDCTTHPQHLPLRFVSPSCRLAKFHRSAFVLTLFTIFLCSWPDSLLAQNIQNPQSAVDNRLRSEARVEPVSLGLQFQIPLGNYPGRGGASVPITLYYSSKVWNIKHSSTGMRNGATVSLYRPEYGKSSASGWTSSLNWFLLDRDPSTETYDALTGKPARTSAYLRRIARIYITLPDGSRHELRRDDIPHEASADMSGIYYSVDGARMRYETASDTLYLPDGSKYTGAYSRASPVSYTDRNGNILSYNSTSHLWTDPLGRTFGQPLPTSAPASPTEYIYTLPGVDGSSLAYRFVWRYLADARTDTGQQLRYLADRSDTYPNSQVSGPSLFASTDGENLAIGTATAPFNPVVLSQIILPNGNSYVFTYNVWGEIDKIVYPSGGYESFAHETVTSVSGQLEDGLYAQANRGVTRRVVSAPDVPGGIAAWQYGTSIDASVIPYRVMRKITAPDGSYTETLYHSSRGGNIKFGFDDARTGKPYDERTFSPSGGMLRRRLTGWTSTGPIPYNINSTATRDARPTKTIDLMLDTVADALATATIFAYDADLNLTSTSRYD